MINPKRQTSLSADFEDLIGGAVEQLNATEIYAALNQAINNQIAWHEKEMNTLKEFQCLVMGSPQRDLFPDS